MAWAAIAVQMEGVGMLFKSMDELAKLVGTDTAALGDSVDLLMNSSLWGVIILNLAVRTPDTVAGTHVAMPNGQNCAKNTHGNVKYRPQATPRATLFFASPHDPPRPRCRHRHHQVSMFFFCSRRVWARW